MATTNYAKADALASRITSQYSSTKGFRGASVECNRGLGTYSVVVCLEPGAKVKLPTGEDHVEIITMEVKKRQSPRRR